MTLYFAANGQPFTDPDALKVDRMSEESGCLFHVASFEGGYAVEPGNPANTVLGNGDDPAQVPARDDIESLPDSPAKTA